MNKHPLELANLLQLIFTFLDAKSLSRASRVCSFWNKLDKNSLWEQVFKLMFPEYYEIYISQEYKSFLSTIKKPFNFQKRFNDLFLECTQGFDENQLHDYFLLRSCNLTAMKDAFLSVEENYKRFFLIDKKGNFIFDFLRYIEQPKRQQLLDDIFKGLLYSLGQPSDLTVWPTQEKFEISELRNKYGINFWKLIPSLEYRSPSKINPLLIFAALCNQTKLLSSWIHQRNCSEVELDYIANIAINFNFEDLFDLINPYLQEFDQQLIYVLRGIFNLKQILGQSFGEVIPFERQFMLSPSFAKKLFTTIQHSPLFSQDLWPSNASAKIENSGLYFLAHMLNQNGFIEKIDLSKKSDENILNTFLHSVKYNLPSRYHLLKSCYKDNPNLFLILSAHFDKNNYLIKDANNHPLYPLLKMNDLFLIYDICKDERNVKLKEFLFDNAKQLKKEDIIQLISKLNERTFLENIFSNDEMQPSPSFG